MSDFYVSDYKIVYGATTGTIVVEVRELIADGWEPLGNLAVVINSNTDEIWMAQPMVMRVPVPN